LSSDDLVIKNGRVAVSSSLLNCAVAAKDGRVTWMGQNSNVPRAPKVVDASGLLVLPGVIDVHVHLRDPGATYKEDFKSGTVAAAAGGVTTVFDMPNNTPPTKDAGALRMKMHEAEKKALVDYALYGLLQDGNSREVAGLLRGGVIGFKCYMSETTGNSAPPSDDELSADMALIARAGRRVAVHAEDNAMLQRRLTELRESRRADPLAHYESRPESVERAAVARAVGLARGSGCDLHVAHLSSAAGAGEVRKAKLARLRRGGSVTAETCPHYLLLDKGDYAEKGALMKVNPSIKRKEDRLALWEAVNDGTIDMIASDHAPHTIEEKTSGASILDKPSGFPGLETSVALMLTCVSRGLLTLSRFVRLSSAGPAKAWGLYPKKGSIAVGADADFTLVDPKREWKIDPEKFLSKAKYSPFEGFKAKGAAVYTIVRGGVVMDHGRIDGQRKGEVQRPLHRLM
jgi:dihydroorotase